MTKKSKKGKKKKLSANPSDAVQIHSAPSVQTPLTKAIDEPEQKGVSKEWVVGALTPEEQKETRAVKAAYSSFWENLKFKKGWDTPLFFQSEVDDLLEQAAEIVGRIRVHLDSVHPGFKMRMAEGNAHEFFWSQLDHPRVNPETFVRELVHQTLKDANGYVEGLSKAEVDKYIDSVLAYNSHEDGSAVLRGEVDALKVKAQRQFKDIRAAWEAVEEPSVAVKDSVCTIVQLAAYRELTRALERVQYYVSVVQEEQAKERQEHGKHAQAAADAKGRFEEQSAKRQQLKAALHAQTARAASPAKHAPAEVKEAVGSPKLAAKSPKVKGRAPSQSPSRMPQPEAARSSSQGSEEDPDDPPAIKRIEELVKEVNVRKSELDRMKDRTQNLDIQELAADPLRSQKTVKSLHERCKYLSLELERDLLKLDAVVGGNKVRPLRKAQVRNIQHMLEDVDSINEKLSGLETSLLPAVEEEQQRLAEQKAKEEAEAAAARREEEMKKQAERLAEKQRQEAEKAKQQAEKAKQEEQERAEEAQREREREAQRESLAERWKQLKLQPKFDIKELRNGYQVSAYIPGMRKEDLEISHSGNTLTLAGVRLPSKEDEATLAQSLRARGLAVDDQNLLRLGAGRFGRFQQQYSLPADVDTSGVKATYEAGVFQVTIPRKSRPPPARGGGGGGFFNDRDFWW